MVFSAVTLLSGHHEWQLAGRNTALVLLLRHIWSVDHWLTR